MPQPKHTSLLHNRFWRGSIPLGEYHWEAPQPRQGVWQCPGWASCSSALYAVRKADWWKLARLRGHSVLRGLAGWQRSEAELNCSVTHKASNVSHIQPARTQIKFESLWNKYACPYGSDRDPLMISCASSDCKDFDRCSAWLMIKGLTRSTALKEHSLRASFRSSLHCSKSSHAAPPATVLPLTSPGRRAHFCFRRSDKGYCRHRSKHSLGIASSQNGNGIIVEGYADKMAVQRAVSCAVSDSLVEIARPQRRHTSQLGVDRKPSGKPPQTAHAYGCVPR